MLLPAVFARSLSLSGRLGSRCAGRPGSLRYRLCRFGWPDRVGRIGVQEDAIQQAAGEALWARH